MPQDLGHKTKYGCSLTPPLIQEMMMSKGDLRNELMSILEDVLDDSHIDFVKSWVDEVERRVNDATVLLDNDEAREIVDIDRAYLKLDELGDALF